MQGDARVLGATSRRRRAENPAAKSRSGAALMTAQPVVLGRGQERQFWTSVSHGTVKVESGTTCPPTTGRWYGKSGDQLRAARPDQAPLRPGQHLPAQPQHRPRAVAQASHPRPRRTGHRATGMRHAEHLFCMPRRIGSEIPAAAPNGGLAPVGVYWLIAGGDRLEDVADDGVGAVAAGVQVGGCRCRTTGRRSRRRVAA
jgi:hypothetical protein